VRPAIRFGLFLSRCCPRPRDQGAWTLHVAYSRAAALEAVGRFLPHIFFMDIAMPEMDDPIVVAVTGFGRDADRQMARRPGSISMPRSRSIHVCWRGC
jgi:CheY-like chemotaxis protein